MSGVPEKRAGIEADALARYERAVELAGQVRGEWVEAGSPLLFEWSNGNISEHPLVRMLRGCELECEKLARPLSKRPMGRPPVAVLKPAGVMPPPLKLARAK